MAYITPPTAAGQAITNALWNTYIRDNFQASAPDIFTNAGDIFYGTGADTGTRLGIGSAGQTLKVNSAGNAPEWTSGGLTRASRSGAQSIPNATNTPISFDTEARDDDGLWVIGSPTVFTIPKAGIWYFGSSVAYDSNSTGFRETRLRVNGSVATYGVTDSRTAVNGGATALTITAIGILAVSDTIDVAVWQNSGGNLNMSSTVCTMWATFIAV